MRSYFTYLNDEAAKTAWRAVSRLPLPTIDEVAKMPWGDLHATRSKVLKAQQEVLGRCEKENRDMTDRENLGFKCAEDFTDCLNEEFEIRAKHNTKDPVDQSTAAMLANAEAPKANQARVTPTSGNFKRCQDIPGYQARADILPPDEFFKQLLSKRYSPELESMRIEARGTQISSGVLGGFSIPESLKVAVIDDMLASQGIYSRLGQEFVEGSDTLTVATLENCQIDDQGLYGFSYPAIVGESSTITDGVNRWVSRTWHLRKMITSTRLSIEAQIVGGNSLVTSVRKAISNVLRWGIERYAVRGEAVNFTGIIDSPATKTYGRAGAGAIAFNDVVGMLSECRPGPNACWIASQGTIPALSAMVDSGSHAVWLGNGNFEGAAGGPPTTLLGIPIIFTLGIAPALGTKGDLTLCSDLSQWYKLVMFSDIIVQTSDSAHWTTGETGMRVFVLIDMGSLPTELIEIDSATYGWAVTLQ